VLLWMPSSNGCVYVCVCVFACAVSLSLFAVCSWMGHGLLLSVAFGGDYNYPCLRELHVGETV
jgi:hypothetical protein